MTEVSPEQKTRRRPIVVALGVLAVVVLALVAWISTRPPSPNDERDTALQGVLSYGGPDGWTQRQDETVAAADDPGWTERDGSPVLLGENRFTVVWATHPADRKACEALADWAAKRLASEAGEQVAATCPGALTRKTGEELIFTSYATEYGQHGRYLFGARIGADTVSVVLTYEGPDDTAHTS